MRGNYQQVPSRDVPALLAGGAALVDVRRPEEWALTGVVAGSHLLTFFDHAGASRPEVWLRELNRLVPEDCPLLLICRTGHRTGLVAEYLVDVTTRQEIYNVSDGIFGWLATGLPVVSPPARQAGISL